MDTLTNLSSSASIYAVCAKHGELLPYKHLGSVKKLMHCIANHNTVYKFPTVQKAFDDHRILITVPHERERRQRRRRLALIEQRDRLHAQLQMLQQQQHIPLRQAETHQQQSVSSTPVSSLSTVVTESRSLSTAPSFTDPRVLRLEGVITDLSAEMAQRSYRSAVELRQEQQYKDGFALRLLAYQVDLRQLRSSLQHEWLDMTVTLLNRRQDTVLFLSSTGAGDCFNVRPDRAVVKVVYIASVRHWVCALWRPDTNVVCVLDSARETTATSVRQDTQFTHFVTYCERLSGGTALRVEFAPVAAQQDRVSCGVFVVAFCCALAASGGAVENDERLLQVDVEATRRWLSALAQLLRECDSEASDDDIRSIAIKQTAKRSSKRRSSAATEVTEVE